VKYLFYCLAVISFVASFYVALAIQGFACGMTTTGKCTNISIFSLQKEFVLIYLFFWSLAALFIFLGRLASKRSSRKRKT